MGMLKVQSVRKLLESEPVRSACESPEARAPVTCRSVGVFCTFVVVLNISDCFGEAVAVGQSRIFLKQARGRTPGMFSY